MVGIAFGMHEDKQAIGDILVSENLRRYELQRVGTKRRQAKIILRGDGLHGSATGPTGRRNLTNTSARNWLPGTPPSSCCMC